MGVITLVVTIFVTFGAGVVTTEQRFVCKSESVCQQIRDNIASQVEGSPIVRVIFHEERPS